jgi:NAD(P)H-flavin reductase
MRYKKGLCKKIGMIAGGTGITPMYQLIRAICEDDTDTTEISLIYANRAEEDILLKHELETFAAAYPQNLKIWYMLDTPPHPRSGLMGRAMSQPLSCVKNSPVPPRTQRSCFVVPQA